MIDIKNLKKRRMKWIEVEKSDVIKNAVRVLCIAEIKHNTTGEVREYETTEILEKGEEHPSTFNWGVNNYSCDCNRRLFFKGVKNEDCEEDDDIPCSDGEFSVNLKNKKDGVVYYREFNKE